MADVWEIKRVFYICNNLPLNLTLFWTYLAIDTSVRSIVTFIFHLGIWQQTQALCI